MDYEELKASINIKNLLYWVTHHGEKLDDTANMATGNHSIERGVYRSDVDGVFSGLGNEADGAEISSDD
jgi:hypothetical protein